MRKFTLNVATVTLVYFIAKGLSDEQSTAIIAAVIGSYFVNMIDIVYLVIMFVDDAGFKEAYYSQKSDPHPDFNTYRRRTLIGAVIYMLCSQVALYYFIFKF